MQKSQRWKRVRGAEDTKKVELEEPNETIRIADELP